MSPTIVHKLDDNARGTLDANISAATLSIPLESGDGAEFPQPQTGLTSSLGSAILLNDTGALGSVAVGDVIRNVTDGSWAIITSIAGAPNSVATTRLRKGTDNLWESGDEWQTNEYVVTATKETAAGVVTAKEKMLIKDRSTDTLTARTRGYDGDSGITFDAGDFVNLFVTKVIPDGIIDALGDVMETLDTEKTTWDSRLDAVEDNTFHYVVATGSANAFICATPAHSAYAAGNIIRFEANHTITGSATVDLNGLGAKTIKKSSGSTQVNLASGDIVSGQQVVVVYDGTNLEMVSPVAVVALTIAQIGFYGDGSDGSITWSANTDLDQDNSYNYTDATLDVTKVLSVTDSNQVLVVKTTGDVTINGDIDLVLDGGSSGAGGAKCTTEGCTATVGSGGGAGASLISGYTCAGGSGGGVKSSGGQGGGGGGGASALGAGSAGAAGGGSGGAGGGGGAQMNAAHLSLLVAMLRGVCCGAGGAGGGGGGRAPATTANTSDGGKGGIGGGSMVWYIGGDLTLGASSSMDCSGENGTDSANPDGHDGGGGGGGGGGMMIFIVKGSITNSGVTLDSTKGAGATGVAVGGAGADGKIIIYSLTTDTLVVSS